MSDKKNSFFQSIKYSLSNWDPFGIKKRNEIRMAQVAHTNEFRQWLLRENNYLQSAEGLERTGVSSLLEIIKKSDVFLRYSDRFIFFGCSGVEYRLDLHSCALFSVRAEIGLKKIFIYNDAQSEIVKAAVDSKVDEELRKIQTLQFLRDARKAELCGLSELTNTTELINSQLSKTCFQKTK